ncbi:hypothetical protein [Nocardioides lacusdianchii]|uniref:hypothetical protein n=1 Tax=Nocardioides lacusdianchii TaxID=2783664 RepID=UPI001CCF913F|nr:hypothetical protein [Nocardioides lacusdianchii]
MERNLGEISLEISDSSEQESALDDELEELEGQAEEQAEGDEEDDDDGPVIMAPGPLGQPPFVDGGSTSTPMMA